VFAIDEQRLLGPFSYLKEPMVADCEDIEALLTSDLSARLAGDEDAIAAIRTQIGDVTDADADYRPVDAEHLVLDADSSQNFVLNGSLAGRNLVVQGPPDTGKSQTIGVADLTLDLFAASASRRYVADRLREVLERQAEVGNPVTGALHRGRLRPGSRWAWLCRRLA
jgi:hypothetical protein